MRYYLKEYDNGEHVLEEKDDIFSLIVNIYGTSVTQYIFKKKTVEDVKNTFYKSLSELNDLRQKIIRLHYGLDDGHVRTLEEIGDQVKDLLPPLSIHDEYMLRLRYHIDNGLIHGDEDIQNVKESIGKAFEFDVVFERVRQIEKRAFIRLRQLESFSSINKIYDQYIDKINRHHQLNFTKKVIEEINQLIFRNELKEDSFLFHILKKKHITLKVDNINDLLGLEIERLPLSVRNLNCLKRMGISYVYQLVRYDNEEKLLQIRNLGKKAANEVLKVLNDFSLLDQKTKTINVKIKKGDIVEEHHYDFHLNEPSNVSMKLFEDLFPSHGKSLLTEKMTYFSTLVTNFLLLLGYSDVEEVMKDSESLDKILYDLGIVEKNDYLKNAYLEYMDLHATYYEITYHTYLTLQKDMDLSEDKDDVLYLKAPQDLLN